MTLDDLIEALTELRTRIPSAGVATVVGLDSVDDISYEQGVVYVLGSSQDDSEW